MKPFTFWLSTALFLSPRILEMAPVCTHRLCVEGLDPTLLGVSAHTHLNKQLIHVAMRDERTERHGSTAASWRRARDAKSPRWPKVPRRVPLWSVAALWDAHLSQRITLDCRLPHHGSRRGRVCAHPLITEDESQQRTIPEIQDHQHAAGESVKDSLLLLQHFNIFWICVQRYPVTSKQRPWMRHSCVSVGDR